MNPAFSIVFFTTLAGIGQGLVASLAIAVLAGAMLDRAFLLTAIGSGEVLLLAALGSSFLHLGHKMRAWRAVLMWRTSWMSREVIALPMLISAVGAWWLAVYLDAGPPHGAALPVLVLLFSLAVWVCTAMIYACLRFVQEWAHPITVVNYVLIGLSSGLVLAGALGATRGATAFSAALAPWALAATLAAWAVRAASLRRNARLKPRSTLQSATGIPAKRLVQTSMGMSAGSFNTREFFHGVSALALRQVKWGFLVLGFAVPCALLAWILAGGGATAWGVAVPLQTLGILAERWFFFAQARHPQNLYYQTVS